jgi:hypothetical protein
MNDNENFMNKEPFKQILPELGKQIHMPPEMILAYARGVLSQDGRSKVASHIKGCNECDDVFNLAKKFLKAEQEFDSNNFESKSAVHLNSRVKSKLELAALLNSKKDELVEMVAKLLLLEDSWISIRPTIIVARNRHEHSARTHKENADELPVAAFSSGTGLEGKRDYDVVIRVIGFVDLVCDLLLERCKTMAEIKSELPVCVDNAIAVLDSVKLSEKSSIEILKVLSKHLSTNEDQA